MLAKRIPKNGTIGICGDGAAEVLPIGMKASLDADSQEVLFFDTINREAG